MVCRTNRIRLTDAGVPPEHVSVEDVEGQMAETTGDFTIKVLSIEGAAEEKKNNALNINKS